MPFCPPPFPLSPKSADTDVNLSVRLQLIHHHGTGDLLYAKHPGLLCFTTASTHLYSGWRWGAISRPNVQTDQQSLFLSQGSTFGRYFYTFSHTFLWRWRTWLITRVVFAVRDLKDEMAEWNIVKYNVPKVGSCAPTTLSGLKIFVLYVLWNSEEVHSRLFHAFSRLSFRCSFALDKRILSA